MSHHKNDPRGSNESQDARRHEQNKAEHPGKKEVKHQDKHSHENKKHR